jgi:hypothetical protein
MAVIWEWPRAGAAGHLVGAPQRLGQWRDVPAGSLPVRGRRVDLVQDPAALGEPVLGPVLLRQPTGHQPAVVGGRGQPARGSSRAELLY